MGNHRLWLDRLPGTQLNAVTRLKGMGEFPDLCSA